MYSCFHRDIFRTKSNIYDGPFFTSVKPYFKNVLNSIEFLLGYIFYITHSFVKKLNCENFWIKSLLLIIQQFFLEIQNYAMEVVINKGF